MFSIKKAGGLLAVMGLVLTFGSPAYGIESQQKVYPRVLEEETDSYLAFSQKLTVATSLEIDAVREEVQVIANSDVASQSTQVVQPVNIPSNQGLVGAAMAQLGAHIDCTAMVENALRALGYGVGDIGPMQFGSFGVQIDPSQASAGDIMMRPGHVAIYAGDGMAVHGGFGWSGGVTYTDIDSNPYSYAVIVRVQ